MGNRPHEQESGDHWCDTCVGTLVRCRSSSCVNTCSLPDKLTRDTVGATFAVATPLMTRLSLPDVCFTDGPIYSDQCGCPTYFLFLLIKVVRKRWSIRLNREIVALVVHLILCSLEHRSRSRESAGSKFKRAESFISEILLISEFA